MGLNFLHLLFLLNKIRNVKNNDFLYTKVFERPIWNETIKGGDSSNPALDLYNDILNKYFLDKSLAYSFIPECLINNIIKDYNPEINTATDFYSSILNLCIEIDGSQHKEDEQLQKDIERDKLLNSYKLKVLRIPVNYLKYNEIFSLRSIISKCIEKNKKIINLFEPIRCFDIKESKYEADLELDTKIWNIPEGNYPALIFDISK